MFPIITSICESVHQCHLRLTAKRKPTMMQQWSTIVDKEKILKSWLRELDRIVETISLERTRSRLFNIYAFSFFIFSSHGIVGVAITAILGFPDRNALLHFCIYSEPRSPDSLWVGHCCWLHMSTSRPILMHMSEKKSWPDLYWR